MKATMSRDGVERTTIRMEYRLGKDEMINLLAIYGMTYGEVGEKLSAKAVLDNIKKQLSYQGLDVLEFGANVDTDEEALDWAREHVERIWK